MTYPISKSLAGVISPFFYQALEANPMLREISLPVTANIKKFFSGKSIDKEIFLRMSILLNNKDLIKKWKKENEIKKDNAIDHLMLFIKYKGKIEDMKEEIEFIGKHIEEMKNLEGFDEIPSEYLSEIFKKARGIQSEKKIFKYIFERLKKEKNEKNRKKLIECIEYRGLNNKNYIELIENIKYEDLSEPLFSMIKDIFFSKNHLIRKKELLQEKKIRKIQNEKKKEQRQNYDKQEMQMEPELDNFQQEYQKIYYPPNMFSPLHYAAKKNSINIGELLIIEGANINAIDIIYQIII